MNSIGMVLLCRADVPGVARVQYRGMVVVDQSGNSQCVFQIQHSFCHMGQSV